MHLLICSLQHSFGARHIVPAGPLDSLPDCKCERLERRLRPIPDTGLNVILKLTTA